MHDHSRPALVSEGARPAGETGDEGKGEEAARNRGLAQRWHALHTGASHSPLALSLSRSLALSLSGQHLSSCTSKSRVALPGMSGGAPCRP